MNFARQDLGGGQEGSEEIKKDLVSMCFEPASVCLDM